MFFVYIIFSEKLSKFYVGHTDQIENRLDQHNAGRGEFTKKGIPWTLKHTFTCHSRSEAMRLEHKIKKRGAKRYLQDHDLL